MSNKKLIFSSAVVSSVFLVLISALIIIALLIAAIFLPMLINDISLPNYENQILQELNLPDGVVIEEYISACCNSSGTGDHTDLYVAVLVKSTVDVEILKQSMENFHLEDTHYFVHDVEACGDITLAMEIADITFEKELKVTDGYYIIEFNKRAPLSWFDLRGA